MKNKLSLNISFLHGRILLVFMPVCFTILSMHAQVTGLPLHKGHNGGDTLYHSSADFIVHNRTFTPVNTITLRWVKNSAQYTVTGEVISGIEFNTVHFSMGTDSASYLILADDGDLVSYSPNVINPFVLAGQNYLGLANKTFLIYNTITSQENIYGNVKVTLDGDNYASRMGSSSDPGAIIENNEVKKVWVHIEDLITIKGLRSHDLSKTDIVLRHQEGDPENTHYGYGKWAVFLAESEQYVDVGSGARPGIVIRNSMVDSVHMVGGGGGFLLSTLLILDEFEINYNHQAGKYAINGKVNIGMPMGGLLKTFGMKYAPSFVIDAGDENSPGFLLNPTNGRFEVEDASFSLKRLNTAAKWEAGGFEIEDLTLGVKNNWPDSIYGLGTFPPGFSLGISLGFHVSKNYSLPPEARFYINSIGVTWQAPTLEQALPLGNTGFNVVRIGGEIDNLLDYHNLSLTGDIGMVYGKPLMLDVGKFGIPGLSGTKAISIVYVEGTFTWSTQGLSFTESGSFGALFAGSEWRPILATLTGDLDITWGGKITLDGSMKAYAPPNDFIGASADISFNFSGDIDATGTASLQVPSSIPVIGGKHIGSANFAVRHRHTKFSQSYAAAWAKFNLIFDHVTAGTKANFQSGHISKIGAGEARALSHQNISDTEIHPVDENGNEITEWYQCGLTHQFSLPEGLPPAYLQNQLVIDNTPFESPFGQHIYYGPVVATLTSPSSTEDIKIITPVDENAIYFNQGQTTPQDNTLTIDFTKNFNEEGSDTIKWITVNQAVEAYGSINWIEQPGFMLTPGQYILTVSGYCHNNSEALQTSDMHYNVSPVYPRPTITLSGDGEGTFTVDYSSYLTDTTIVSLYWSATKGGGGNLIAHHAYHQGELIGDSLYRWVKEWDPGILGESKVFFYAVIDDHINNPVQSEYDSIQYVRNLQVIVNGGNELTSIILSPADTTLSMVTGVNVGNATFNFANVPLGEYTVQAYNADTAKSFDLSIWLDNADLVAMKYQSPDWVSVKFNRVSDQGTTLVTVELLDDEVSVYGEVVDTAGYALTDETKVVLLDEQNHYVTYSFLSDLGLGYTFDNQGVFKLGVQLPSSNNYHFSSLDKLEYITVPNVSGYVYFLDSIELSNVTKAINFRVLPGGIGPVFKAVTYNAGVSHPVENVVVTIRRQDSTGPTLQAVSNSNGLVVFDAGDVDTFTNYTFTMAWPEGYETVTPQGQVFAWDGRALYPFEIIGQQE